MSYDIITSESIVQLIADVNAYLLANPTFSPIGNPTGEIVSGGYSQAVGVIV